MYRIDRHTTFTTPHMYKHKGQVYNSKYKEAIPMHAVSTPRKLINNNETHAKKWR
jgi:hypothetical protein